MEASIAPGEIAFVPRYLERAMQLVDLIFEKFWDDGLYFTPSDGERLVHRPRAPHDNAWPSGISTSVFAFLRLYELTGRTTTATAPSTCSARTEAPRPRTRSASPTYLQRSTSCSGAHLRSCLPEIARSRRSSHS